MIQPERLSCAKQDVLRGLVRAAWLLLCLSPLVLALAQGPGGWIGAAKALCLAPTLIAGLVGVTVIEGWGARLPAKSPGSRLGCLLAIACVASLILPALVAQAIYLEESFSGGGSVQGFGQVKSAFERGILPGTLVFSVLFAGLPAAYVASPRVRAQAAPTAEILVLTLVLSAPLLFSGSPFLYWIPLVIFGGWSMLYSAGDGVAGFLFAPHEAEAAKLCRRREVGELSQDQLQFAADLGHGPARRALQLPPAVLGSRPEELISRVEGAPALARVGVLLTQLTLGHASDARASQAACRAITRQLVSPQPAHLEHLDEHWARFPWVPVPEGDANQRALHFALELARARPGTSREVLMRSLRGALRAAREVASDAQIVSALRGALVPWALEGTEPLACFGA